MVAALFLLFFQNLGIRNGKFHREFFATFNSKKPEMFKKLSFATALIGLFASVTSASVQLNLKIHTINGVSLGNDTHSAVVGLGDQVVLSIYATIDTGSDQGLAAGAMRFTSTEDGAKWGNLSNPTCSWPLYTLGTAQNYDSNPDWEWGGPYPSSSVNDYYFFGDPDVHWGGAGPYSIGTITWTCTYDLSSSRTLIQAVPYVNSKTSGQNCLWYDPSPHLNEGMVTGESVSFVWIPEPATWVLLAVGALTLLAGRRFKRQ